MDVFGWIVGFCVVIVGVVWMLVKAWDKDEEEAPQESPTERLARQAKLESLTKANEAKAISARQAHAKKVVDKIVASTPTAAPRGNMPKVAPSEPVDVVTPVIVADMMADDDMWNAPSQGSMYSAPEAYTPSPSIAPSRSYESSESYAPSRDYSSYDSSSSSYDSGSSSDSSSY